MPITKGIAEAASWWGSPHSEYQMKEKSWVKLFFCINWVGRKYIYLIGDDWLFEVFVRFH
jgi:hypothetical protein